MEKIVNQFHVHNGEVYERRLVHKFRMGDVEDPTLYAAQPIYDWQQTEKGKWVMKNGLDPTFHVHPDIMNYGHIIAIVAHISPKRWTEFVLRGWNDVDT